MFKLSTHFMHFDSITNVRNNFKSLIKTNVQTIISKWGLISLINLSVPRAMFSEVGVSPCNTRWPTNSLNWGRMWFNESTCPKRWAMRSWNVKLRAWKKNPLFYYVNTSNYTLILQRICLVNEAQEKRMSSKRCAIQS